MAKYSIFVMMRGRDRISAAMTILKKSMERKEVRTDRIRIVPGKAFGGPKKQTVLSGLSIMKASRLVICPICKNAYSYDVLKELQSLNPQEFEGMMCPVCGKTRLSDLLREAEKLMG